jgi:hypothetical protein
MLMLTCYSYLLVAGWPSVPLSPFAGTSQTMKRLLPFNENTKSKTKSHKKETLAVYRLLKNTIGSWDLQQPLFVCWLFA